MGTKSYFNGIQPADTGVNNTFYNTHTNTQKSMTSGGACCFLNYPRKYSLSARHHKDPDNTVTRLPAQHYLLTLPQSRLSKLWSKSSDTAVDSRWALSVNYSVKLITLTYYVNVPSLAINVIMPELTSCSIKKFTKSIIEWWMSLNVSVSFHI